MHGRFALGAVVLAAVIVSASESQALIIGNSAVPGTGGVDQNSINTTAPADDPGWHNSSASRSAIYLGDQWVMTATHVETGSIVLPSGEYPVVPNTETVLDNPSTFLGRSLSSKSDIKLYRIGLHPTTGLTPEQMDSSIKAITIAPSTPSVGTEVLAIAAGTTRRVHPSNSNGAWRFDASYNLTGDAAAPNRGYLTESPAVREKAWATNRIASPSQLPSTVNNATNAILEIPDLNDTIGVATSFDQRYNDDGSEIVSPFPATDFEFQAFGGDSGGPVFAKNSAGAWELFGVFHGIYLNSGQSASAPVPVYGNHSGISDLSTQAYYDQIADLRASNEYSIIGDMDLDGIVSGEILGETATGDLARIVDNYGMTHAEQDAQAWVHGDLNMDGVTDIGDFVLWRGAAAGAVSVQQFALAVGSSSIAVPEPGMLALALSAMAAGGGRRRDC
ncbi:MAG: hypothetical protein AAFV43_11380 [Planctomycetota bacterium]